MIHMSWIINILLIFFDTDFIQNLNLKLSRSLSLLPIDFYWHPILNQKVQDFLIKLQRIGKVFRCKVPILFRRYSDSAIQFRADVFLQPRRRGGAISMIIIKLVYPNSDGIWKHTDGGKWENEKLKKCNKRGKKTYQYKYSYKPLSQFHLCFCRMPSGTNQMIAKSWWNFLLSKFLLLPPSSSLWKQQDKSNHQHNIYVCSKNTHLCNNCIENELPKCVLWMVFSPSPCRILELTC